MNMDVDGWNSTTRARKERRGVKDVQVDADLAAEEYGGNKDGRKNPQDSPGSKTITCSSIKSSNKVGIASYETLVPLRSSTQTQSSKLSSNSTTGQMPGTAPRKVPSISTEFMLPDVCSYLV